MPQQARRAGTEPLEVAPTPVAMGYGNPITAVAAEFFKLHSADSRRQANAELDERDKLAEQFEEFSKDPRYANHPKIQREAHMHAVALRGLPYDKKRPKEYLPDEKFNNLAPAYAGLFHQHIAAETRRTGEPPKPAEPQMPAPPPAPFSAAGRSGEREPMEMSAPPMPGGQHIGPNQITPAPAIGAVTGAPTPPDMQEIYPMSPPEMAAYGNSIPASAAPEIAARLGIDPADPSAVIDLRQLKALGALGKDPVADRRARLAIHGLDEDEQGNIAPLSPDKLSPEQLYKRASTDQAEAHIALLRAQTISEPIKRDAAIRDARERTAIARQNMQTAVGRLGVAQGQLGVAAGKLDLERSLYGPDGHADSSASSGGSGGPDDLLSDNLISQTVSGRMYVDLTGYTGKLKNALKERYESQGIPALESVHADTIVEIDGARMNYLSLMENITSELPKDATGRITQGLGIKLSQLTQANELRAAFQAYRTTAIKALRAAAGSKGFRMTEAEIMLAVNNDVPRMTDTVGTALQKQANMFAQFDNAERAILTKRRGGMRGSSGKDNYAGAGITPPPVPNQGAYKQTATGPGGHKIGTNDGGATWYDVVSGQKVQ